MLYYNNCLQWWFRRVNRVWFQFMVCLQSSILIFLRKSRFMPCEIGPYNRILDFGKTHFILERVECVLYYSFNKLQHHSKFVEKQMLIDIEPCVIRFRTNFHTGEYNWELLYVSSKHISSDAAIVAFLIQSHYCSVCCILQHYRIPHKCCVYRNGSSGWT